MLLIKRAKIVFFLLLFNLNKKTFLFYVIRIHFY